jgi:SAM-dependent methyltransferase
MRGKIHWRTNKHVHCAGIEIPVSESLPIATRGDAGLDQALAGIRPNSKKSIMLKSLAWPFTRATEEILGHQYLQHQLGKWLRRYVKPDSVFLECGPGDMSFRLFLPKGMAYNTIEFAVSEFQVHRVVKRDPAVNFCLASITDIPVADNTCDIVACIEMLEQIPDIDKAMEEIKRVAKPGAKFLCTIGNGKCEKVLRKGKNAVYANFWSDDEFQTVAERHGFKLKEHYQTGRWVPLPKWLTGRSMHLPFTSTDERYNSYFVYLYEIPKGRVAKPEEPTMPMSMVTRGMMMAGQAAELLSTV